MLGSDAVNGNREAGTRNIGFGGSGGEEAHFVFALLKCGFLVVTVVVKGHVKLRAVSMPGIVQASFMCVPHVASQLFGGIVLLFPVCK